MSAPNSDPLDDLLARWEARQQDAANRSRQIRTGDLQAAYFFRGVAETYKTALAELRALLNETVEDAAPEALQLLRVPEEEVRALFARLNLFPRILRRHDDGAYTAIFSRLQPVSQARRTELLTGADPRLRILHEGALLDTGDPYIEFGFVADD